MKTSSSWEWENLVLFPGNGGHKSSTGDCKVKEDPTTMTIKQDSSSASGFLRIQGGDKGRSPSPRGNRTPAVPEEKRLNDDDDDDEEEEEEEEEVEEEEEEVKKKQQQQQQKHGGVVTVAVPAGSGDSVIGLKLGKRTYFESVKAIPASAPSPSPSIPSGKKQRAVMQGTQVPRCQVEGCKTELTGAKDYHRRHKVCELHSKSPKVIVAGIEQRFCQQCSRFHILSEFDEGKRSCRRRLAGHNERRRKPQPDSLAISPARFASTFYDDRRLGSILMDRSPFMHSRFSSSSILGDSIDFKLGYGKGYWPRVVKSENQSPFDGQVTTGSLSRYNADKLLFFLQGSNKTSVPVGATAINQDIHQYMQSSGSHVGQALTLSSSSSGDDLAGLSGASGNLSGVSDSGCALSLLSSNSWSSRATGSASFDHMDTRAGVTTMDQLIQDTQSQPPPLPPPRMAQPLVQQQHHQGVQHNFGLVTADKLLTICSQAPSTGFPVTSVNSMGKEHQGEPLLGGVGNYEGHVFGLLQGNNFRASQSASSQDIERTIDLMHRRRSSQTHTTNDSHAQPGIMHQEQLLRSFESSVYDTHQML